VTVLDKPHSESEDSAGDRAGEQLNQDLIYGSGLGQTARSSNNRAGKGLQEIAAQTSTESAGYRAAKRAEGVIA
jgi:hypothetical protein